MMSAGSRSLSLMKVAWLWTNFQLKLGSSNLHCSFLAKPQHAFSLLRGETSSRSFFLVNTWMALTLELSTRHIQENKGTSTILVKKGTDY